MHVGEIGFLSLTAGFRVKGLVLEALEISAYRVETYFIIFFNYQWLNTTLWYK